MTGSADRYVRLVGCVISAAVVFVALRSIVLDAKSANYVTAAERLETNRPVPADFVARLASAAFRSGLVKSCRPDIVDAVTTLVLARLDTDREEEKADMIAALKMADRQLQELLACSPTDGNLWARLAMVEAMLHAPEVRVGRILQLSAELSPFEPGALHARLAFWIAWPTNSSVEAKAALKHDMATLVGWMAPDTSVAFLNALPPRDQALVRKQLARQSTERLSELKQAGLQQTAGD